MDLAEPYAAVSPTLDGPVLAVLASTTRPLTGREVARLVRRGSWPGVRRVLHRLAGHGLIHTQEAGSALLYTLNRDHIAAPVVDRLVGMRVELVRRLRLLVCAWKVQPVHASLFGSAARGDGDIHSDIDLFIVRPRGVKRDSSKWRAQVDELATAVLNWTGNHAAIIEVAGSELPRLRRSPLGSELVTDGITLSEPAIADLLAPRR